VSDAVIIGVTAVVLLSVAGYLVWMMVDSIRKERRRSHLGKIWPNFALSLTFCVLFFVSWAAQALAEWGVYRNDQLDHDAVPTIGGYLVAFGQSTLENWQSEFLQLFSFVVLAAVLIHRGSAESRDSEDRIEAQLKEIAQKVDELVEERAAT
jgi:hypothetical protein